MAGELDLPKMNKKSGHRLMVDAKKQMFEAACFSKMIFGLSHNTSLFFRGSCFEMRSSNVLGINESQL